MAGGRNASLCWHHPGDDEDGVGAFASTALIFLMSPCPKPSVSRDFESQPDRERKELNSSEVERGEP